MHFSCTDLCAYKSPHSVISGALERPPKAKRLSKSLHLRLPSKLLSILGYLACVALATLLGQRVAYEVLYWLYKLWPVLDPTTGSYIFAAVSAVVSAIVLLKVKKPKL